MVLNQRRRVLHSEPVSRRGLREKEAKSDRSQRGANRYADGTIVAVGVACALWGEMLLDNPLVSKGGESAPIHE